MADQSKLVFRWGDVRGEGLVSSCVLDCDVESDDVWSVGVRGQDFEVVGLWTTGPHCVCV